MRRAIIIPIHFITKGLSVLEEKSLEGVYYRKVQTVGRSTYIISIPKDWARIAGIKPGSTLKLRMDPSGSLIIESPIKERKGRKSIKIYLDPSDIGRAIRECVSAYIAGFNEIEIQFNEENRGEAQRVRKILEEIILGLSLLEETPNSLKFYIVVDPRSMKFWDVVRRACKVANSMLSDVISTCNKMNEEILKSVIERDQLVDKLYILSLRQLTGALLGEFKLSDLELETVAETLHIFIAVKSIERIADHATIISSEILKVGLEKCSSIKWLELVLGDLNELLRKACKALLGFSKEEAHTIAKIAMDIRTKIRDIRNQEALRGNVDLLRIIDSLERIAGYLMDVAEATIDIGTVRSTLGIS